jgi:uncharacterized protein YjbI with pentapeptide repeats
MANPKHVALLRGGVIAWNEWRHRARARDAAHPDLEDADLQQIDLAAANLSWINFGKSDLCGKDLTDTYLLGAILNAANLSGAKLIDADLSHALLYGANLQDADLEEAVLDRASLREANLKSANFYGASLDQADLTGADLSEAILRNATLVGVNLSGSNLDRADLTQAYLSGTIFGNTDLNNTRGLDACVHWGPSIIDFGTLRASGRLPLGFLRGVGLPDNFIQHIPSLLDQPIQFYSCFISYSSKDEDFAHRLYADLQNEGVRCWFAPHDLKIGARTLDAIDEAIRLRDKVLLILSKAALASDWVEDEVSKAFAEERDRKQTVLFPIRLDNAVMNSTEAWARKLRDQLNIGDFTRWKDHDAYQESFRRVVRDLVMTPPPGTEGSSEMRRHGFD